MTQWAAMVMRKIYVNARRPQSNGLSSVFDNFIAGPHASREFQLITQLCRESGTRPPSRPW